MSYKDIDFENDCVAWVCHYGKEMRNRYISDGFFNTAQLIYESAKDSQKNGYYEDDLVYPFLHSIRHAYELRLKMIMDDIKTFDQTFNINKIDLIRFNSCIYSHDIGEILNFVKDNIYLIDNRLELELKESIDAMELRVSDFIPEKDVDPYRYATDRSGNENLLNLNQVSFNKAIEDSNKFKSASEFVIYKLSCLFDEYSLGTHYKDLSRFNLFQIATELPKYEKWTDSSFDDVKKALKEKYGISSNTLSEAIKIIQNSKELSFYISYNRREFHNETEFLKKCFDFNVENGFNVKQQSSSLDSVNLEELTNYGKKCFDFISILETDNIVLALTYYLMGREQKHSEQFAETMAVAKDCSDPNDKNVLINYFRGKLTSGCFIPDVLDGIRRSGDFELFINLYEYCQGKNVETVLDFHNEYIRLKQYTV